MTTDLMQSDLLDTISSFIKEVRRTKNLPPIVIEPSTSLVDGSAGIDSLDLAALVVELEARTGKDPFVNGFRDFDSVGALVKLYS